MGRALFHLWLVLIGVAAIAVPALIVWEVQGVEYRRTDAAAPPAPTGSPIPFEGTLRIRAESGQSVPDASQFMALEAMANAACRCARHKSGNVGKAECWSEFDASARTFSGFSDAMIPCIPSITQVCFADQSGDRCIDTDVEGFCSAKEYSAAMALRDQILRSARTDADHERAEREAGIAIEKLIARWDRGEPIASVKPQGCSADLEG